MQSDHGSFLAPNEGTVITWVPERKSDMPDTPIENAEKLGVHTMLDRMGNAKRSSCGGIQA